MGKMYDKKLLKNIGSVLKKSIGKSFFIFKHNSDIYDLIIDDIVFFNYFYQKLLVHHQS